MRFHRAYRNLPMRSKIGIPVFLLMVFYNVFIFKFIYGHSWITSFYFIIVTLSSVGYGDVVPRDDFTRLSSILLIITGFATIAFIVEDIVENVIREEIRGVSKYLESPLEYVDHVIVGGYGSKGRILSDLLRDRGFRVVVVDKDPESAQLAYSAEFVTLNADISRVRLLEMLALKRAKALFLVLRDDAQTLQTSILARSFDPDLEIYAEFHNPQSYHIARHAGVSKASLLPLNLANALRSELLYYRKRIYFNERTLITQRAQAAFLRLASNKHLENLKVPFNKLGEINLTLNIFEEIGAHDLMADTAEFEEMYRHENLYVVQRRHLDNINIESLSVGITENSRLLIAGYNSNSGLITSKIGLDYGQIYVLTPDEDNLELDIEATVIRWNIVETDNIVKSVLTEGDTVISFVRDPTYAFILLLSLKKLEKDINILQVVEYTREAELFARVGADAVISSQLASANELLSNFMKHLNLPPSLVFANCHIFEEIVSSNSSLFKLKRGKIILRKKHKILLRQSNKDENFLPFDEKKDHLQEGEHVLVLHYNKYH